MAVMARMSVSAVLFSVFMCALAMCTDWCRSFRLLLGSLACLGLGRMRTLWVTVGGRCDRGLGRFAPLAYVRFVANAGLCLMSGDVGLFSLWRCFLPVFVLSWALPACVLAI